MNETDTKQIGSAKIVSPSIDEAACYCRGTRITTPSGDIRVEELDIGDCLITLSGQAKPLKWMGRRSFHGRFSAYHRNVVPVQILAGALGNGVPRRDLFISPLHAMYLDGVLLRARDLVNGVSILQADTVSTVEYYHLELAEHDIIFAENAPSETFAGGGSRAMFHNAASYDALYPDDIAGPAQYCAPRPENGPILERVRARIMARAVANGYGYAPQLAWA